MKYAFRFTFWLLIAALLFVAVSCASESVSKPSALLASGAGAGTAAVLASTVTAGWAAVVGVAVAFVALFFSRTEQTVPQAHGFEIPWFWIGLGLFLFFKGEHVFNFLFRKGGFDSILRFLTIKRTIKPKPVKDLPTAGEPK